MAAATPVANANDAPTAAPTACRGCTRHRSSAETFGNPSSTRSPDTPGCHDVRAARSMAPANLGACGKTVCMRHERGGLRTAASMTSSGGAERQIQAAERARATGSHRNGKRSDLGSDGSGRAGVARKVASRVRRMGTLNPGWGPPAPVGDILHILTCASRPWPLCDGGGKRLNASLIGRG